MSGRAVVIAMFSLGIVLGVIAFLFAPRVRLKPAEPQQPPSVAVLPFHNESGVPELELLASSIAGAVTAELASSGRADVIPASATLVFKDVVGGIGRVAAELDADYVIAGSVGLGPAGEARRRIEVDAYLYRAGVDEAIWVERLAWDESDAAAVPRELAARIGASLAALP